eukprot:323613_1
MNQQLFQNAYSPFSSHLPKATNKPWPVLYVIADKQYSKSALSTSWKVPTDPTEKLWEEILKDDSNEAIRQVLTKWINKDQNEIINRLEDITPLRIIMHELRKCKANLNMTQMRKSQKDEVDTQYKSKYFALIWVPANKKTGFNKKLYNELICAFNECDYICKPLDKHCIYIDGPNYQWDEFKCHSLAYKCNYWAKQTDEIKVKYTVIVHQMKVGSDDKETEKTETVDTQRDKQEKTQLMTTITENKEEDINEEKMSQQIELQVKDNNTSQSIQYWEEPMSRQRGMSEIKSPKYSILKGTFRSFAFVWIELDHDTDPNLPEMQRSKTMIYPTQQTLPSYAVMKGLHKQPTDENPEVLFNVELMAYDNCWHNLDLVVDRKFQYLDCLLLLVQFMFLPFFVAYPIRKCMKDDNLENMKARFRPSKNGWRCCYKRNNDQRGISYFNLDKLEQLPYDITILWRAVPKEEENSKCKEFVFRFISFIIALFMWSVIISGPVLYHVYNPSIPERANTRLSHVDKLQFFDCWGPLILYVLFCFTIIWWACASRILIGPKQHLLLYHKVMLHRPVSRNHRELTRTDWGALVNLHEPLPETLFTFSYKKEFLLVKRPTDQLIDKVMMKSFTWPCCRKYCGLFKLSQSSDDVVKYHKYIVILSAIVIYIGLENLENFIYANYPFYIGTSDSHWAGLTAYNIISALIQSMFLCGFILMWETMIFRIYGHLNSVKTLSQMIIRDTYTEYIDFENIDNILSWLTLENFVKRKGMTLFSSVETPLLTLGVLAVFSWGATFYCIVQGVGLELKTDNSIFSNSALETWFYLGLIAFIYTFRMIWAGRKYHRETIKQSQAIKRQCRKENKNNLSHFLNKDQLSIEQYMAQSSCEQLLQHVEHSEIVPRVFGIQFDELLAKAFITALISILPTIAHFVIGRVHF